MHVVEWFGSGMRVSASFQIILRRVDRLGLGPRVVGQLGSRVWISAGFQIIALTPRGNVLGGKGNCPAGEMSGGSGIMSEGERPVEMAAKKRGL